MTFTVLARSADGRTLGVASATRTLSVGAGVPAAAPGVGVVASQAWTNRALRGVGLELMARGLDPSAVLDRMARLDPRFDLRQVGLVTADGRVGVHTGSSCTGWAGAVTGEGWVVMGNLLAGPGVVEAMAEVMATTEGPAAIGAPAFADLLVAALRAGDLAGGDSRGRQSAALLVVDAAPPDEPSVPPETLVDLRVDDHPAPVEELGRLVSLVRAEAEGAEQARPAGG